jgi:hypothetical protein
LFRTVFRHLNDRMPQSRAPRSPKDMAGFAVPIARELDAGRRRVKDRATLPFAHDLRENASRLSQGKPPQAFPDQAL